MGTQLSIDSSVVVSPDQVSTILDDEAVVLGLTTSQYYGLGGVGRELWAMLATPTSVRALCEAIQSTHDVDPETCRSDVLSFLGSLAAEGLIEVVGADAP
jgi:hypothetical protein